MKRYTSSTSCPCFTYLDYEAMSYPRHEYTCEASAGKHVERTAVELVVDKY